MKSSPRVIAYSFNAAICCPPCTAEAVATGEILSPPSRRRIKHTNHTHFTIEGYQPFSVPDDLVTTNGDPVHPVFSTDDYPDGLTCDECGVFIPRQGLP